MCKYFNQRLLDANERFTRDIDYLLTAQYAIESASIAMTQTRGRLHRRQVLTAGAIRNKQVISEMIQKDYACCFLEVHQYDVLGMIKQLGIPMWFLTLSATDMQWPDVIQHTALTDEDVKTM